MKALLALTLLALVVGASGCCCFNCLQERASCGLAATPDCSSCEAGYNCPAPYMLQG